MKTHETAGAAAGNAPSAGAAPVVELLARDLPAFCPNPAMPIWNHHPRVFLDLGARGEAMCPYCGTRYRLKAGQTIKSEHA